MLLPSIVALFLAQAPLNLAAPGFTAVDVDPKKADFASDYFAEQLATHGQVKVTTKGEITAILGIERQKQLLGCQEGASQCLAEMAGALGADGVIVGSLARFGEEYAVTLRIVSNDGKQLATSSARLKGDTALLDWLGETARAMAPKLRRGSVAPETRVDVSTSSDKSNRVRVSVPLAGVMYERHLAGGLWLGLFGEAAAGISPVPGAPATAGFVIGGGLSVAWVFPLGGAWSWAPTAAIGYALISLPDSSFGPIGTRAPYASAGAELRLHGFGLKLDWVFALTSLGTSIRPELLRGPARLQLFHAWAF